MKTEPKTETATHTPGPWMVSTGNKAEVLNWSRETYGNLRTALSIRQSLIGGGTWTEEKEAEAEANAALIAAAPELLEALRLCSEIVAEYRQKVITGHLTGNLIKDDWEPLQKARAAIAKAEGRDV